MIFFEYFKTIYSSYIYKHIKELIMNKKILLFFSAVTLMFASSCANTEKAETTETQTITIRGTVAFSDPEKKMQIIKREGFDKKVISEFEVNTDGTFSYEMEVTKPGVYTIDCINWETINFWAENEDVEINFRGVDTAKVKIKNPKFHMINSGPLNDVMNDVNFLSYANYQMMIDLSQGVYRADINSSAKSELSGKMYEILNNDYKRRMRFLAENYADRNSVLAVLSQLSDRNPEDLAVLEKVIAKFETINPDYEPFIAYKKAVEEARYQRERLAIGKPAPEFSFPNPEGDKSYGPADFEGKVLLIDFWASWCGPCVAEIPHLKEVYAKYKSKGVEILSVSIDSKDESWKKALTEQNMDWYQVCAPNSGKEIMKDYQFSGIPYMVLLDREGKIIAKNVRGESIDKALDAFFANEKK